MKKQYLIPETEITWVNLETSILTDSYTTSGSNAPNLTIDNEANSENYWSY